MAPKSLDLGMMVIVGWLGFLALGCRTEAARAGPHASPAVSPSSVAKNPSPAPSTAASVGAKLTCPEEMRLVPGGRFWVGATPEERFSEDESPRFLTELAPFCLDATEVTVKAYGACVASGACKAPETGRVLCNGQRPDRSEHPINCVTHGAAESFCAAKGARLPSEVEWEFAARGGDEYRRYPWGDASPDGRACWKHFGTCEVKSFAAGAFGLYDLSGNVWEWTDSWYGPYPFPPETAFARVYRGGSFSRRFEKWMHTRLRNRAEPSYWGSHLGFRCALTAAGATCPLGLDDRGRCRQGVLDRACRIGQAWNGVRCAAPGAPRCAEGRREKPGFGCVLDVPPAEAERDLEAELRAVRRERSAENDADCRTNQRDRPLAFRYSGGSHEARNVVSRRDGCKNRDVGVGWNSTCCP